MSVAEVNLLIVIWVTSFVFSGYIYYLISEAVFLAVCWQDIRRKLGTDWDEMLCLRDKELAILGLELNPLCCKLIEMHVFVRYSHQNCHVRNNSCIFEFYALCQFKPRCTLLLICAPPSTVVSLRLYYLHFVHTFWYSLFID